MKEIKYIFLTLLLFLTISLTNVYGFSFTDISSGFSGLFSATVDDNEGNTSFRSLLIPLGGRAESLGGAYTGLGDDVAYLRFNPAAGSIQKETQLSLYHNTWIADSNLETLAYTTRFNKIKNLSVGGYVSCFYVPFTEYNIFGEKTNSSYYVETITALNASYNFFAGYDFKGLAVGANIKAGWRNMPNFTDNDTNLVIKGSGFEQSSIALMADLGLMLQFNFLKFFASREPNVRIGFSAQNIGIAVTGLGKTLELDAGLPTLLSLGMSVRFIKPITISFDFAQPSNFLDIGKYLLPYFHLGVAVQFTNFLSLLFGLQLKGAKPTISTGIEFELTKVRINFNYSLDFTSSLSPLNRFSLSTKLMLGDKGRQKVVDEVTEIYKVGLIYYQNGDWENAIKTWQKALELDKHFDPAILGIKSAENQIKMFDLIEKSLMLD